VFSFQDDDEQWISLRYDLTAPLAALRRREFLTACQNPIAATAPATSIATRSRAPAAIRQFMQFDADTIGTAPSGSSGAAADAEDVHDGGGHHGSAGSERHYVVKVNNRKVLDGVMEASDFGVMRMRDAGSQCCGRLTSWTAWMWKAYVTSLKEAVKMKAVISQRERH